MKSYNYMVKHAISRIYRHVHRNTEKASEFNMAVPVLMYHSVGDRHSSSISVSQFDEHVAYISQNYEVHKVCELREIPFTLQRPVAVITFDDGFLDNYDTVLPILKKYKVAATFFVCTGFVSREYEITRDFRHYKGLSPMRWENINELVVEGMEVGAHSVSHRMLAKLTLPEKKDEITGSKHELQCRLGVNVQSFAYPFGYPWSYDKECEDIVRKEYRYCCTTSWKVNSLQGAEDSTFYRLCRIGVDPCDSAEILSGKMKGDWDYHYYIQLAKNLLSH